MDEFFPPEYLEQVYGKNPQFSNGTMPQANLNDHRPSHVYNYVPHIYPGEYNTNVYPGEHQPNFYPEYQPNLYPEYVPGGHPGVAGTPEDPYFAHLVTNPYPQMISPAYDVEFTFPPNHHPGGQPPHRRFYGGGAQDGHFQGGRRAYYAKVPGRTFRQETPVCKIVVGSKVSIRDIVYEVVKVLCSPETGTTMHNHGICILKNSKGLEVVQKKLKMSTSERRTRAVAEKKVLYQIAKAGGSPHVNKIYEAIWEPGSPHSMLMLEYCNRGSLEDFIERFMLSKKKIDETFCWRILYGISAALCMCHHGIKDPATPVDKIKDWNTICHLDIKPANVFLHYEGHEFLEFLPFVWPKAVLGDFGCSVTRNDIMTRAVDHRLQPYGTPFWFPPENKKGGRDGMGRKGSFGKYTDIWQMGGVVQAMCRLTADPDMFWVDEGRPAGKYYSDEMNEALVKCMERDVKLRPTALDVATAVGNLMKETDRKMGLVRD